MSSSRFPTQMNAMTYLEVFVSFFSLFLAFFFFFLFYKSFTYILWFLFFCFYQIAVCLFTSMSFLWFFFCSFCFVSFVLFQFLFSDFFRCLCFLMTQRKKMCEFGWKWRWAGSGRIWIWGMVNHYQNILDEGKKIFNLKKNRLERILYWLELYVLKLFLKIEGSKFMLL